MRDAPVRVRVARIVRLGSLLRRRRTARAAFMIAAIAVCALVLVGANVPAWAATKHPAIEITVIYATRADAGASIDPALRDLPQLTRDQPFVRYNVYKVLARSEVPLEAGKGETTRLPNGRVLQLTLVDDPPSDHAAAAPRYHVRAEIGEPGKQAFLKLLEVTASGNEPFFVGGQSYQGGTLFLELVVRP